MLSAKRFIEVRTTHGGPAAPEISAAVQRSREALTVDAEWLRTEETRLANANQNLQGTG